MRDTASPGCADAWRMAAAKRDGLLRQPTEDDAPPPRPLPGPKAVVLPGQLALGEEPEGGAERRSSAA